MDQSQLKLSEKKDHILGSVTMKEPIYFMNLHTIPYMSKGVLVAPELSVETE